MIVSTMRIISGAALILGLLGGPVAAQFQMPCTKAPSCCCKPAAPSPCHAVKTQDPCPSRQAEKCCELTPGRSWDVLVSPAGLTRDASFPLAGPVSSEIRGLSFDARWLPLDKAPPGHPSPSLFTPGSRAPPAV